MTQQPTLMAAFVKSDLRQTIEYGACFNQYIFDILSKLVDKSNEQVAKSKTYRSYQRIIRKHLCVIEINNVSLSGGGDGEVEGDPPRAGQGD